MSFIRACIHHVIIVLSGPDPRPQRNNREPSLGVFCIWGPLIRLLLTITAVSGLAGWWHRMSVLSNDGCHLIVRCCVSQFFFIYAGKKAFSCIRLYLHPIVWTSQNPTLLLPSGTALHASMQCLHPSPVLLLLRYQASSWPVFFLVCC